MPVLTILWRNSFVPLQGFDSGMHGAGSSGRVDEEKRFPEETATAVPALPALS